MAASPVRPVENAGLTAEDVEFLDEIAEIAAQAVQEARAENTRMGLSNFTVRDGHLIEERADGSEVDMGPTGPQPR
jgi:GAF domain-containing protein